MHALLAVHTTVGGGVDPHVCSRMLAALQHRPREQQGAWQAGGSWLATLAWPTTTAEARQPQPWHTQLDGGGLVVALDGRIDNRNELYDQLDVDAATADEGDVALVLRAFARWGVDALPRLLGDYALVLIDTKNRRLIAARDPSGSRPLYYARQGQTLLLASEPACLCAAGVERTVDEDSVLERLLTTVHGNDRTLYQHIRRLPPAHQLTMDERGLRISRFHCWSTVKSIRYRTDDDYALHFREALDKAVRCRLQSQYPVALELSGGVDSSTVCVLASRLAPHAPLAAYSLVFPGLPCDERRYMRAVIDKTGLPHHAFEPLHLDMELAARQAQRDQDMPAYPNGMMSRRLRLHAQDRGGRVTVTGNGADEWWTGSGVDAAELLRTGALRQALGVLAQQQRAGWATGSMLRHALGPLLPWRLRALRQRIRAHEPPWPWIRPALLARTRTLDRLRTPPRLDLQRNLAVQDIVAVVEEGWTFHAYEMEAREAASYGIEVRQPFSDRRLCEWALGVPLEQRARGGVTKFLLRRALRGDLPELVRTRNTKAEFSHLYLVAVEAARPQLAGQPLLMEQRGWVDSAELWDAVERVRSRARAEPGGRICAPQDVAAIQALWCALAIELWLRGSSA